MRTTRPVLLVALAVLVAVLVSGCSAAGTSTTSTAATKLTGEEADVAQVVDDLQSAAEKRDGKKICTEFLAPALLKTFTAKRTCKDVMTDNLSDTDTFGMTVDSVTVTGNTATAVVSSDAGKGNPKQKNTFTFEKDAGANGVWKISNFG